MFPNTQCNEHCGDTKHLEGHTPVLQAPNTWQRKQYLSTGYPHMCTWTKRLSLSMRRVGDDCVFWPAISTTTWRQQTRCCIHEPSTHAHACGCSCLNALHYMCNGTGCIPARTYLNHGLSRLFTASPVANPVYLRDCRRTNPRTKLPASWELPPACLRDVC
jgi:hypothetical protein